MRTFIAIQIPPEIQTQIDHELLHEIPTGIFKVVEPQNIHLTLRFLGEKSLRENQTIKQQLTQLHVNPFEITLNPIGSFGTNVLWLGVREGSAELAAINQKLTGTGFPEDRFSPHITLARNQHATPATFQETLQRIKEKNSTYRFRVNQLHLMESVYQRSHTNYFPV
ncbi:MAG: RNA 2',3'-cyclic phosphodiesterase [Candidatus Diapherotrites archaeon]|nr:RNA 2',3'-cyclic phosphodiesterase [Candidatus Diapherotrites archaeon]